MTKQEEIINNTNYIPLLDYGFIGLVDAMPNTPGAGDEAIVQAARTSYGKGTKSVRNDAGLIRYLLRHEHTTPFEMVEFKFHIKMPIFVVRQHIRHRTACLTGDMMVSFDLPGSLNGLEYVNGISNNHGYLMSIEDIFNKWHGKIEERSRKSEYVNRIKSSLSLIEDDKFYSSTELSKILSIDKNHITKESRSGGLKSMQSKKGAPRIFLGKDVKEHYGNKILEKKKNFVDYRSRISKMKLRNVNEDSGVIEHSKITDIWQTGTKPVYQVEFEDGYKIKTTKDHLYFTDQGWLTLEQLSSLKLVNNSNKVFSYSDDIKVATNGVPLYQDKEYMLKRVSEYYSDLDIANEVGCSKHTVRKWLSKLDIKRDADQIYKLTSYKMKGIKRPKQKRGKLLGQALANVRKARSGPNSNFWRGGIMAETNYSAEYNRDWYHVRNQCFERDNYVCQISGKKGELEVHHITPRWADQSKIFDINNLITLHNSIHRLIHKNNLEEKLKYYIDNKLSLKDFYKNELWEFVKPSDEKKSLYKKKIKQKTKLKICFRKITNITYIGDEMTYDMSVEGPYHNFIANGVVVHNSVNEYSGRYSEMSDEFYIPDLEQIKPQAKDNKQGRFGKFSEKNTQGVQKVIKFAYEDAYNAYQTLLGRENSGYYDLYNKYDGVLDDDFREENGGGLAKELARSVLPVGNYTELYWKNDLNNIFKYLKLRSDNHAQYEIRVLADAMGKLIQPYVPIAYKAYEDYVLNSVKFSGPEMNVIKSFIKNMRREDLEDLLVGEGLSLREINEFAGKIFD